MTGQLRAMDIAYRDGRHILLVPRDPTDWSGYQIWGGGLIANWSDEDCWWVNKTPGDMIEGTGRLADSIHFIGWWPFPDEEIPDANTLETLS